MSTSTPKEVFPALKRPVDGEIPPQFPADGPPPLPLTHHEPRRPGRLFFANPGPTNIPDSIQWAAAHHSVDFFDRDWNDVYMSCVDGVRKVLKTTDPKSHVFFNAASGNGAWEAALVNLLTVGDTVLMLDSGFFSDLWTAMARNLALKVEVLDCDIRRGVDLGKLREVLEKDAKEGRFKAVCAVHNETSSGVVAPIHEIRKAMDAAGHPGLLMVDTISSLASINFEFDAWGVDAAVCGGQKGLMLPTGLSFTGVSAKGLQAHLSRASPFPAHYFSWSWMLRRPQKSFAGTIPTQFFYALKEALRLILDAEGLENVLQRHHRLAEGVRRAIAHWGKDGGPQILCLDPSRYSDSITTVMMPEGCDPEAVRKVAYAMGVSLGASMGRIAGKVFRIGHLGDLNEPMVLGTLGVIEAAFLVNKFPITPGGVTAAAEYFASCRDKSGELKGGVNGVHL
ncbi:serine--glyoxylate transaminase [Hyaloraphidium curvatum]|nr:serine--glyoxylate transaminase [Hyaloraphidium curvatum]